MASTATAEDLKSPTPPPSSDEEEEEDFSRLTRLASFAGTTETTENAEAHRIYADIWRFERKLREIGETTLEKRRWAEGMTSAFVLEIGIYCRELTSRHVTTREVTLFGLSMLLLLSILLLLFTTPSPFQHYILTTLTLSTLLCIGYAFLSPWYNKYLVYTSRYRTNTNKILKSLNMELDTDMRIQFGHRVSRVFTDGYHQFKETHASSMPIVKKTKRSISGRMHRRSSSKSGTGWYIKNGIASALRRVLPVNTVDRLLGINPNTASPTRTSIMVQHKRLKSRTSRTSLGSGAVQ